MLHASGSLWKEHEYPNEISREQFVVLKKNIQTIQTSKSTIHVQVVNQPFHGVSLQPMAHFRMLNHRETKHGPEASAQRTVALANKELHIWKFCILGLEYYHLKKTWQLEYYMHGILMLVDGCMMRKIRSRII